MPKRKVVTMFAVTDRTRSWYWNMESHRAYTVRGWEKDYGEPWAESKKQGYRVVKIAVVEVPRAR